MKRFTKKQKKSFFLWQIRLFGSLIGFFSSSFYLLVESKTIDYSQNIFTLHVGIAWFSVLAYLHFLYYYTLYRKKLKLAILFIMWYIILILVTGALWSKISFGFFIITDPKVLGYFILLIYLLILFVKNKQSFFLGLIGFFLLIQERFSVYWLNSVHQSFSLELISSDDSSFVKLSLKSAFAFCLLTFSLFSLVNKYTI